MWFARAFESPSAAQYRRDNTDDHWTLQHNLVTHSNEPRHVEVKSRNQALIDDLQCAMSQGS